MKLVSIAERKQFRICKMQKHKITKMQNYKNTKTQNYKNAKMQKGAKSIFQIDKENAYILQRKIEEGKSVHRAVHCAQMCQKYTPKVELGHPKWQNGISQMMVWGIGGMENEVE